MDDEFYGHAIKTQCSTCHRFELQGEVGDFVKLDNGRKLCSDCHSIAIMDMEQCRPLIKTVHKFYKSLNLKMDKLIPILLVEEAVMRIWQDPTLKDVECAGLTISGAYSIMSIKKCSINGENIEVEKSVMIRSGVLQNLATLVGIKRALIAILLLFGHPDVIMGGILAHEMMHAWLAIQGCRKLEKRVEEGICEVMSYIWMEWFCLTGVGRTSYKTEEQAEFTRYLKDYYAQKMQTSEHEFYGQGFRDAMWAVRKHGLKTTLRHIIRKRTLPTPHYYKGNVLYLLKIVDPIPMAVSHQFLRSLLSHGGLHYAQDTKWHIYQHLVSLTSAFPCFLLQMVNCNSVNFLVAKGNINKPSYDEDQSFINIPITIWLTESYPYHPPSVYLIRTKETALSRSSRCHVKPSSVRYLKNWAYPTFNLLNLVRKLSVLLIRSRPTAVANY